MKIKIYLFRLAIAFTAFVFGVGFFNAGRYFQSAFSTVKQKATPAEPVSIEEITFPPDIIEQANAPVFEQPDVAENTESEFDAEGYYYIVGELPKGFKDFEFISIFTNDSENASEENDYKGTAIPPEGYVWTKKEFEFTRVSVSNKRLAFETETVKGVSYKFSGKFFEQTPFWNVESGTPVLEGRLVKLSKGKKVAESNVRLMWYGGC